MNKTYSIHTPTKNERFIVLTTLFALGYKWHGEEGWTAEKIEEKFPQQTYPYTTIRPSKSINGNTVCAGTQITLTKFLNVLDEPKNIFKLNKETSAELRPDGMTVQHSSNPPLEIPYATLDGLLTLAPTVTAETIAAALRDNRIRVQSNDEKILYALLAHAVGYTEAQLLRSNTWPNAGEDDEDAFVANNGADFTRTSDPEALTIGELRRKLFPEQLTTVAGRYTVTRTADTINVGCQSFPIDTLKKLAEAAEKIRNDRPKSEEPIWFQPADDKLPPIPEGWRLLTVAEVEAQKKIQGRDEPQFRESQYNGISGWFENRRLSCSAYPRPTGYLIIRNNIPLEYYLAHDAREEYEG